MMTRCLTVIHLLTITLLFNGCAVVQPKSNAARLADISGADVVLSLPSTTVDLNLMQQPEATGDSIMRLVDPKYARIAFQSNGSRMPAPVEIGDPSDAILKALSRYYTREYQLRFIAKGTIRNIDPDFINRALKKGDYVLDVRLTSLELRINENNRLYPQASIQLTVIDRARARNVLQDTCTFSEPENARNLRYYSANNGVNLTRFLQRFASPCLQYFARGTPLPSGQVETPVPQRRKADGVPPFTRLALSTQARYYPDYQFEPIWLNSVSASFSRIKPLSPTLAFGFSAAAVAFDTDRVPAFGDTTFYGGEFGLGIDYFPSGDTDWGYQLLLKGQLGQSRQQAVRLSSNAIGFSAGVFRPVLWGVHAGAAYTFWQHVGLDQDSNLGGHEFGVSLRYLYR